LLGRLPLCLGRQRDELLTDQLVEPCAQNFVTLVLQLKQLAFHMLLEGLTRDSLATHDSGRLSKNRRRSGEKASQQQDQGL
jgi:hypothetical protein